MPILPRIEYLCDIKDVELLQQVRDDPLSLMLDKIAS